MRDYNQYPKGVQPFTIVAAICGKQVALAKQGSDFVWNKEMQTWDY
jgi:hypothetical protein